MEETKLNFDAPLMSVRRFSMASTSSVGGYGKKNENFLLIRPNTLPPSKSDYNLDQVTDPVAVPFYWEHIPGIAKNGNKPMSHLEKEYDNHHGFWLQNEAMFSNENVLQLESSREGVNEKGGLDLENDDEDDVYSDAPDTLSPTDSFSANNCSVSGLTGSDGPHVKPFGTFSTDHQTRDFIMSRFLPAAKAMVLEPGKFSSRKQLVVIEQPREAKKVVDENKKVLVKKKVSSMLTQFGQEEKGEESDSVDDECDDSGDISAKGCGLFPGLCFRNSLGPPYPVSAMKIGTQVPMFSAFEVGKSGRTNYFRSHSQNIKKYAQNAAYKHKSQDEVGTPKLREVKNKWIDESKRSTSSSNLQTRGRSSPFGNSREASQFQNKTTQSCHETPLLEFRTEVENSKTNRLNMYAKVNTDFWDAPYHQKAKPGSDLEHSAIEKTLYEDTVDTSERPSLNSSSTDEKMMVESTGKNIENPLEIRGMKETTTSESVFQDIESPESLKVREYRNTSSKDDDDQIVKSENLEVVAFSEKYPLPPPLLKSPSESWLGRTLPSVPMRNSFSRSKFGNQVNSRKKDLKISSTNTSWETIVKASYLHHDHVRYSEELIAHGSKYSKDFRN